VNITLNHTQAIAVVGYGCFTLDGETYGFEAEWDNDYPGTIGIRYQDTEEKELYVWTSSEVQTIHELRCSRRTSFDS